MDCNTKTKRQYRVLSHEEREEIMIGLRTEESIRSIAKRLQRQPSVILREIRNNSTEDKRYQAYWAQNRSDRRRIQSRKKERIPDEEKRSYIRKKLNLGWSPEQIAGRMSMEIPGKSISHETIYQYIFKNEPHLTQFLVCGRKKRRKRIKKYQKRSLIPNRTGIENRSPSINERIEIGHWEADTAVSRQSKEALMVLQERLLGLTFLEKLPRCAPQEMKDAIISRLKILPPLMRRSITFDNGQENRNHLELKEFLGVETYFCNPYSSWQKGSVENAVGLTRREWPKKTDYSLLSKEDIAILEFRLNTRPRKRLGFLTPYEAAIVALTA